MTFNEIVLHVRKMEKALVRHPEVEDVVVLSEEKPEAGYVLKVFVEPSAGDEKTTEEIKRFCYSQQSPLPFTVVFGKIPRTPSGKIARQQLLKMA